MRTKLLLALVVCAMIAVITTTPHLMEVHSEAATSAIQAHVRPKPHPAVETTTTTSTTLPPTTTTTVRRQPVTRTTQAARPTPPRPVGDMGSNITRLGYCESGYNLTDQEGYYEGAFQFAPSTWRSMNTGYAHAYQAPDAVQRDAVARLVARNGGSFRSQFPGCSRKLGLP